MPSPKSKKLRKIDGTNELIEAKQKRGGRPSALNDLVQEKIVSSLRRGSYVETAAALAGVSKQTLYDWFKRGNRELERVNKGEKPNKNEKKFVMFLDAAYKAMAEHEDECVERLGIAGKSGDWRVDAWVLERKFPTRWGNRVSVSAKQGEHDDADKSLNDILADELEKLDADKDRWED